MNISEKPIREIILRYIEGVYMYDDAQQLFRISKTIRGKSELEECMDEVWGECSDVMSASNLRQQTYKNEAQHLLNHINKKNNRTSFFLFLKYAAILILGLIISWGGFEIYRYSASSNVVYIEIQVDNGTHKQLTLPDGTKVILNAGSYMRYPSAFSDIRYVEINGEAFFEVIRNEKIPFIVKTKNANIRVLGTSFNVKAYEMDAQLEVSVRTGKVQVDMPEAMMKLLPNEQLALDKSSGEFQKRNEDIKHVIAWINGGLYFNRTPIKSVIHELVRRYNCEIEFASGFVYDEYIYGEHDNKSLESVLNSIQYSTDVKYKKEGSKYILYKE